MGLAEHVSFIKQYVREDPIFANINLLGKCNADCYFCLGKDIPELLGKHNQLRVHFDDWTNFEQFKRACRERGIERIYVTGQNTDSLLYRYLDELVDTLQEEGFKVGLRTNGYLALESMDIINKCKMSTGYSIHTLSPDMNSVIMGVPHLPPWDEILPATARPRIAMVIGRYNTQDFESVVSLVRNHPHVRYMQARRISTDTRQTEMLDDIRAYEGLHDAIAHTYARTGEFYGAPQYDIDGVEVTFWRTVQTTVNSYNYFTDGTLSKKYFVVEGYLESSNR